MVTKMIKLEKGAKVKVRLDTGEVVEAAYDHMYHQGEHEVKINGREFIATDKFYDRSCVRFVGNPCVLLHEGVSV